MNGGGPRIQIEGTNGGITLSGALDRVQLRRCNRPKDRGFGRGHLPHRLRRPLRPLRDVLIIDPSR